MSQVEPLTLNTNNKYTIFPIKYHDIYNFALKHKEAIWFTNEIDMAGDIDDWGKLGDNEKYFIKHVLAFFAASDGIIMENLSTNFCNEIQVAEVRQFYSVQMFMESEHNLTYSTLIETYIDNSDERIQLFNAIENFPAIRRKASWAAKWITSDASLAKRLVAVLFVENIFFSGAFCAIYFIGEMGIMKGLCSSNRFIARDEGMHCDFAVLLYTKYIVNKLSQDEITELITEAVDIEKEFINESLPCALLGMNAAMMSQYIEYVAHRVVSQLGYISPYISAKCPFGFMDKICLQNQSSFFDVRVTEYKKDVRAQKSKLAVNFDADF